MKDWKKLLRELGLFNGTLLIISLILSLISYLASFSSMVITIILMIIVLFTFGVFGIRAGRSVDSKGYLAGLRIGCLEVLLMFMLALLVFRFSFNLATLVYYGMLILGCVTGSMIGINKK